MPLVMIMVMMMERVRMIDVVGGCDDDGDGEDDDGKGEND